MPEVVPATLEEPTDEGLRLHVPPGSAPAGGRRAGLTAHWFCPRMIGQEQRVHTGWLSSDGGDRVLYAPHTKTGYRLPPSKALFTIACSSVAPRLRSARKRGLAPASG